jgi:hypothetical protein
LQEECIRKPELSEEEAEKRIKFSNFLVEEFSQTTEEGPQFPTDVFKPRREPSAHT